MATIDKLTGDTSQTTTVDIKDVTPEIKKKDGPSSSSYQRFLIAKELFNTEIKYQKDLGLLLSILKKVNKDETYDNIPSYLTHLEALIKVSKTLVENNFDPSFLKNNPELKEEILNIGVMQQNFTENKNFNEISAAFTDLDEAKKTMGLGSEIIKSVQRFPRYNLLFKDIQKNFRNEEKTLEIEELLAKYNAKEEKKGETKLEREVVEKLYSITNTKEMPKQRLKSFEELAGDINASLEIFEDTKKISKLENFDDKLEKIKETIKTYEKIDDEKTQQAVIQSFIKELNEQTTGPTTETRFIEAEIKKATHPDFIPSYHKAYLEAAILPQGQEKALHYVYNLKGYEGKASLINKIEGYKEINAEQLIAAIQYAVKLKPEEEADKVFSEISKINFNNIDDSYDFLSPQFKITGDEKISNSMLVSSIYKKLGKLKDESPEDSETDIYNRLSYSIDYAKRLLDPNLKVTLENKNSTLQDVSKVVDEIYRLQKEKKADFSAWTPEDNLNTLCRWAAEQGPSEKSDDGKHLLQKHTTTWAKSHFFSKVKKDFETEYLNFFQAIEAGNENNLTFDNVFKAIESFQNTEKDWAHIDKTKDTMDEIQKILTDNTRIKDYLFKDELKDDEVLKNYSDLSQLEYLMKQVKGSNIKDLLKDSSQKATPKIAVIKTLELYLKKLEQDIQDISNQSDTTLAEKVGKTNLNDEDFGSLLEAGTIANLNTHYNEKNLIPLKKMLGDTKKSVEELNTGLQNIDKSISKNNRIISGAGVLSLVTGAVGAIFLAGLVVTPPLGAIAGIAVASFLGPVAAGVAAVGLLIAGYGLRQRAVKTNTKKDKENYLEKGLSPLQMCLELSVKNLEIEHITNLNQINKQVNSPGKESSSINPELKRHATPTPVRFSEKPADRKKEPSISGAGAAPTLPSPKLPPNKDDTSPSSKR